MCFATPGALYSHFSTLALCTLFLLRHISWSRYPYFPPPPSRHDFSDATTTVMCRHCPQSCAAGPCVSICASRVCVHMSVCVHMFVCVHVSVCVRTSCVCVRVCGVMTARGPRCIQRSVCPPAAVTWRSPPPPPTPTTATTEVVKPTPTPTSRTWCTVRARPHRHITVLHHASLRFLLHCWQLLFWLSIPSGFLVVFEEHNRRSCTCTLYRCGPHGPHRRCGRLPRCPCHRPPHWC
jgi:hypothetical protein